MAKAKKRVSRSTGVKKAWHPIMATRQFNNQLIGETLIADTEKSIGKIISINLMNLTGDMKKQNLEIAFKIDQIKDGKFLTSMIGYKMLASSLKRMVRRGKKKIDCSFEVKTADGYKLKLKLIMITLNRTSKSSLTALKKECLIKVDEIMEKMKYDVFVDAIINHRFQMQLKKPLSKIYPLRIFEVTCMRVKKKPEVEKKENANTQN